MSSKRQPISFFKSPSQTQGLHKLQLLLIEQPLPAASRPAARAGAVSAKWQVSALCPGVSFSSLDSFLFSRVN